MTSELARPLAEVRGLESWLRSGWRSALLVFGLVCLATLVTAYPRFEALSEVAEDVDWRLIFGRSFATFALWGLASAPILFGARWLSRVVPAWLPFLALQIPLSIGVAQGAALIEREIDTVFLPRIRAFRAVDRSEPDAVRERGRRPRGRRFGGRRPPYFPRGLFTYWFILGVGAGAASWLRARDEERRAGGLELRAARLQTELANAQLSALQSQLHPHFLFNALHTVGGLVRSGEEKRALTVLTGIADLLRVTLDRGDEQTQSLADELELARHYLAIETVRFGDRLSVSIAVDTECEAAYVPALVLLPLIENAIRYGISARTEGGMIEVRARKDGGQLEVVVRDDGPGFAPEILVAEEAGGGAAADDRQHIGHANTRARLRMLYGDGHEFRLENASDGGARVTIRVPFSEQRLGSGRRP